MQKILVKVSYTCYTVFVWKLYIFKYIFKKGMFKDYVVRIEGKGV